VCNSSLKNSILSLTLGGAAPGAITPGFGVMGGAVSAISHPFSVPLRATAAHKEFFVELVSRDNE